MVTRCGIRSVPHSGGDAMPEAVIVAAGRSPIGRAFKGHLVDMRADDLAAYVVGKVLEQVPQVEPEMIEDLICGCGLPGGEQGFNLGRAVSILARLDTPGCTITRYCSSSLQTTRMAYHAIKAGEGDTFLSVGVECVSRFGNGSSDIPTARNPPARIVSTGVTALEPEIMGLGPIEASKQALKRAGMTIDDVDVVEINEAFAAQVIPSARGLGIDPFSDKLNPHGGAIALGHPFGMTGARILCTLLNDLRTLDRTYGLETMCVGGGQGMAMIVERLS